MLAPPKPLLKRTKKGHEIISGQNLTGFVFETCELLLKILKYVSDTTACFSVSKRFRMYTEFAFDDYVEACKRGNEINVSLKFRSALKQDKQKGAYNAGRNNHPKLFPIILEPDTCAYTLAGAFRNKHYGLIRLLLRKYSFDITSHLAILCVKAAAKAGDLSLFKKSLKICKQHNKKTRFDMVRTGMREVSKKLGKGGCFGHYQIFVYLGENYDNGDGNLWNSALLGACETCSPVIARIAINRALLQNYILDYFAGMCYLVHSDQPEKKFLSLSLMSGLIDLLEEESPSDFDVVKVLRGALSTCKPFTSKLLLSGLVNTNITKIRNDPTNKILYSACYGGHSVLVQDIIELGFNNWAEGFIGACESRSNPVIARMMFSKIQSIYESDNTNPTSIKFVDLKKCFEQSYEVVIKSQIECSLEYLCLCYDIIDFINNHGLSNQLTEMKNNSLLSEPTKRHILF